MTSIAVKDGIMVSDGRVTLGDTVIKDDMVKVFCVNNHLVGGAGRARSISTFVHWLQKQTDYTIVSNEVGDLVDLVPPVLEDDEGFSALVLTPTKQVLLYDGNIPIDLGNDVYTSIGSGSVYCLAAMDAGASAEGAVRIAMKRDVYSGGEVTIVQLEEEPQELTREVAENMSKEDLLAAMFGEEEGALLETTEDAIAEDNEDIILKPIHTWTEYIVLWEHVETKEMLFEIYGIEYDVGTNGWISGFVPNVLEIGEARDACEDMNIEFSKSNTKQQLCNKIRDEVKSKIPQ